jgi:hypothetical protein
MLYVMQKVFSGFAVLVGSVKVWVLVEQARALNEQVRMDDMASSFISSLLRWS